MHEGRVIADGDCQECLRSPEVRRSYWQIDDLADEVAPAGSKEVPTMTNDGMLVVTAPECFLR